MTQPEALRLADELLFAGRFGHEHEDAAARRRIKRNTEASAELRRLHEVNQELVFALRYIEAQTHLGHIHDTASSALAKARGTE